MNINFHTFSWYTYKRIKWCSRLLRVTDLIFIFNLFKAEISLLFLISLNLTEEWHGKLNCNNYNYMFLIASMYDILFGLRKIVFRTGHRQGKRQIIRIKKQYKQKFVSSITHMIYVIYSICKISNLKKIWGTTYP